MRLHFSQTQNLRISLKILHHKRVQLISKTQIVFGDFEGVPTLDLRFLAGAEFTCFKSNLKKL